MTQSSLTISKERLIAETRGKPMCYIIARKGSQRLKNKNKLPLLDVPLCKRIIDIAKEANIFEHIIVSSDDMDILEMAYEADVVPNRRPPNLATKWVQMKHVIRFLFTTYTITDYFCMLTPCTPLVTAEDLRKCYDLLLEKKANYVVSAKRMRPPPQLAMRKKGQWIEPILDKSNFKQSQLLEPMYALDGGIVFARTDAFINEFAYDFRGTKCYPYFFTHPTVDIDTQEDFDYAEYLLLKREGKV